MTGVESDYTGFLVEQTRGAASVLHQFRLGYSNDSSRIHAFMEGDNDPLFYMPEIDRFRPGLTISYNCGGKHNVFKIKSILSKDYPEVNCLYFVDRDFDDFLNRQPKGDSTVFFTDYYSIENYFVDVSSLRVILTQICKFHETEAEFKNFLSDFSAELKEYHRIILPVMAWIVAARERDIQLNLNNAKFDLLFKIVEGGKVIRKRDALKNLLVHILIDKSKDVSLTEIRKWFRIFSKCEPKLWVRGKYELWFLEEYIKRYFAEKNNIEKVKKKWIIPQAVMHKSTIEVLGGRIPCPNSLTSFLIENLENKKA